MIAEAYKEEVFNADKVEAIKDTISEVYKDEVFNADKAEALKDLLGIKSKFPDILDVIEEVLKCFPGWYTLDDIYDMLYKKDLGL